MTRVNTVLGTISAHELGFVAIHEHIGYGMPGCELDSRWWKTPEERYEETVPKLRKFHENTKTWGPATFVEATGICNGRDIDYYKSLSDKTGVHIVASTGFVGGDTALPFFERATVEYLTDQFVHEISVGIGNTGAKAGIIKVGVSRGFKMKELDKRIYRAAARASKITGAPIFTHLAVDSAPALAIFAEEGLPCHRVLFGHADTRHWATGDKWPVANVEYRPLYLRTRGKLAFEPEPYGVDVAHPEGFYQAPLTITDKVEKLTWSTEPFDKVTSIQGVGAAHLYAAIDQDDTNFILRFWDEAPSGKRQLVTTGFLKASHRELDERTSEGNPYHPHTRSVPVEPGALNEYVIRIYPFANDFRVGHKLVVELMCNEPMVDEHNALLPPDAFHLPVGRPVML